MDFFFGHYGELLPLLAAAVHDGGHLEDLVVHLVQAKRELEPVLSQPVVQRGQRVELARVRALAAVGPPQRFVRRTAQLARV